MIDEWHLETCQVTFSGGNVEESAYCSILKRGIEKAIRILKYLTNLLWVTIFKMVIRFSKHLTGKTT